MIEEMVRYYNVKGNSPAHPGDGTGIGEFNSQETARGQDLRPRIVENYMVGRDLFT